MAEIKGLTKRPPRHLSMSEIGVRALKLPASSRCLMSPSKNSFLPQLQDVDPRSDDPKKGQGQGQQSLRKSSSAAAVGTAHFSRRHTRGTERECSTPERPPVDSAQQVMPVLEKIEQDFAAHGGELDLPRFTRAMLHHLEAQDDFDDMSGSGRVPTRATSAAHAAAAMDLFRRVDYHSEGTISWEGMSSYLIEYGMSGGDDTVSTIKTYAASSVHDHSSHDSAVDKLVYLQEIDAVVCLSAGSQRFRLYDPKRCTIKDEVAGHRSSVVSCCYVGFNEQLATTSVDQSVCLWDAASLRLRSRISAKEIQLCVQYDAQSSNLFTGSVSGSLCRWDLNNVCLRDSRPGQHRKEINDLLMIRDLGLLASASSDGYTLLWDVETMRSKCSFKSHKKGAFSLAWSTGYKCLLTAGADQEALVWNPYVDHQPIFKLKGHTRTLCGVSEMPGTPQIITADISGTFRLWDMRNFRCVQTFGSETGREFNTFCVLPPHKRVFGGGSRLVIYDYQDEGGDECVTDSGSVADALFNPVAGSFYTMSNRNLKFWNAGSGQLVKVLRDVTPNEITAACLSDNHQKLYLGGAHGRVSAHALHNGKLLTEFESHETDISKLEIWKGTNWLFSSCWDGTLKFHTDELTRKPICHSKIRKHRTGITCLKSCPELFLLGSGSNDMQVVLYDLRTRKFEHALTRFQHPISAIDFIPARCLLAVGDAGGLISLWRVRPHKDRWALVYHYMATADLGNQLPTGVGAISFALPAVGDGRTVAPWLYSADSKGHLRCWDLSGLFTCKNVLDGDLKVLFEEHRIRMLKVAGTGPMQQRTPSASVPINRGTAATPAVAFAEDDDAEVGGEADESPEGEDATFITGSKAAPADVPPPEVLLVREAVGHTEAVVCMHALNDPQALVTCGLDRRVQTWSDGLEARGALLQTHDPSYRFPFDPIAAQKKRLEEASKLLQTFDEAPQPPRLPSIMRTSTSDTALLQTGPSSRRNSMRRPSLLTGR
eukprot:TRINITY_DN32542_c0_g1_i1.p1 TRINITY_DN32542_c0_g1~~TRINITY_DN32542_c0_g1_i1.p1  ORF type:complete len:994 (+),score=135.24 TRINITY_DN32542_c0_g1_i1:102-3083(+)